MMNMKTGRWFEVNRWNMAIGYQVTNYPRANESEYKSKKDREGHGNIQTRFIVFNLLMDTLSHFSENRDKHF